MKNVLFTLLYLSCSGILYAQGWQRVGTGPNKLNAGQIDAICTDTNGLVYAVGVFVTAASRDFSVARWDGTTWSEVDAPGDTLTFADFYVTTMCIDKYHNIYVAGYITDSNGYYYVAKWDGVSWSELGTGGNALNANGPITALCSDKSGNIYAGGYFTHDTSLTAGAYVAKWNGTTWSELGTGSNALKDSDCAVSCLAADTTGNIYVTGGIYNEADSDNMVAEWNGTSWVVPGAGTLGALHANGPGRVLYADRYGNIYGGSFFDAAGRLSIWKWDGAMWTEVGGDSSQPALYGFIRTMTMDGVGNLYAAGDFAYGGPGYNYVNYVAKWDGSVWAAVDSGADGFYANCSIDAISADSLGHLYAGGLFTDSVFPLGYCYVAEYTPYPAGIPFVGSTKLLQVYPNPAMSFVTVASKDDLTGTSYALTDAAGKTVASGTLSGFQATIDISRFSLGVYLLQIADDRHATFKIIKE